MKTQLRLDADNKLLKGLDLVIDFATLGEYRVVTDDAPHAPAEPSPTTRPAPADLWADGVRWHTMPRRRETECRLPRARDRRWARERIRG